VKRRFDWYGLALPAVLVAGLACLGISLLGNGTGFAIAGWLLVGIVVIVAPVWIYLFVRARRAFSRVAGEPAELRFLGSVVGDDGRVKGRDFVVALAGREGIRILEGTELRWSAKWAEIGEPSRGVVRAGRTEFPTIAFDRAAGDTCVLAVINPNGWTASFGYADDVQAELQRLAPRS
jgi:hypothetical protein